MSDTSDLGRLLKRAQLPELSAAYWEEFVGRATRSSRRPEAAGAKVAPNWVPRLALGLTLIAVGVVLVIAFGRQRASLGNEALLQNASLVQQTMAMFPHRLRAIVIDEHGMKLLLSEDADVPSSPPLWVRYCDGRRCVSFVTFSGQEVVVGGQRITALADPRGEIVLIGKNFVWTRGMEQASGRVEIEAKELTGISG